KINLHSRTHSKIYLTSCKKRQKKEKFVKKHLIDIFTTPRFMLISEKNQIDLLQRLHDLLQHDFTLSKSFKFLLQHIRIKSPILISLINTRLDQGAQCYEILLLL